MIGWKVQIRGLESSGFAEVNSDSKGKQAVHARFYAGPTTWTDLEVPQTDLLRQKSLPSQSRCFRHVNGGYVFGRVLTPTTESDGYLNYRIQFPNTPDPELLREDEFTVLSYSDAIDAVATLASGGQETPFFEAKRSSLLSALMRQSSLCAGLTGVSSARIDLMPHQVEVARRVLQDPTMRYLLADEVGLGKTIEAGIVLKQLSIDHPDLNSAVFVPLSLVTQWQEELEFRFGLVDVPVASLEDLPRWKEIADGPLDIAVIDEAHRAVGGSHRPNADRTLSEAISDLARHVPHLLLLSATPILHREQELLSLLHLLDPEAYTPDDTSGFRRLLSMRQDIGRSLLALENVTMVSTARNHIRRVAQLLPQDATVAALAHEAEPAAQRNDRAAIITIARKLHLHLSETYRVHRRMLRTRRALLGDLELGATRKEESPEHEADEDRLRFLWEQLEEWRVLAAAHTTTASAEDRLQWIHAYFSLAQGIACNLLALCTFIHDRLLTAEAFEHASLHRMLATASTADGEDDRPSLLVEILRLFDRRHGATAKHVIFCSDSLLCQTLAHRLNAVFDNAAEGVDTTLPADECEERLQRFRTDPGCRYLLADTVVEEGHNLQFARGMIFYDLPWAPMRLEQRIGRVDRIDRTDDVAIKVILTVDDEEIALDQAWYNLLLDGFGIFSSSLSDLQFLIDTEMPRLQQLAFEAGPLGLLEHTDSLRARVAEERRQLAEQDVIDGLRIDAAETSPLWRDLQDAESMGSELSEAFCAYAKDSLGMWITSGNDDHEFSYSLHNRKDPLIPADRIAPLVRYAGRMFSSWCQRALRNPDIELLRPGHPVLQSLEWLLKWDPRGRAYALWRYATIPEPELVFRIAITAQANLSALAPALNEQNYNDLSRQSLLRLLRVWFPGSFHEVFLDGNGRPAEPRLVTACMTPYDKDLDMNLGGERAIGISDTFGRWNWPDLCRNVGDMARATVSTSSVLNDHVSRAIVAADAHFALVLDRLCARRASGVAAADRDIQEQLRLKEWVATSLASPSVRIDAIGAYVFSEQPICPR